MWQQQSAMQFYMNLEMKQDDSWLYTNKMIKVTMRVLNSY